MRAPTPGEAKLIDDLFAASNRVSDEVNEKARDLMYAICCRYPPGSTVIMVISRVGEFVRQLPGTEA